MTSTFVNLLGGWGTGHVFGAIHGKALEVRQGGNHYLAAFYNISQAIPLTSMIGQLTARFPESRLSQRVSFLTTVGAFANIPFQLLLASIEHGDYEAFAHKINTQIGCNLFPSTLSNTTLKITHLINTHTEGLTQVAMVAGSVALLALGNPYFGGATLIAVTYQIIDQKGLVPRKISLFMETYMPTVSLCGLLVGGSLIQKSIAVIELPFHFFPSVNQWGHQKLDVVLRKLKFSSESILPPPGPTLQECQAPLTRRKDLTFKEINQILNEWHELTINPSHCSAWVNQPSELPEDRNFHKFKALFEKIDWTQKKDLVTLRLKDDDHFIDLLKAHNREHFPGRTLTKEILQEDFLKYVQEMAQHQGLSIEQFMANWIKTQMTILVDVLEGKKRVKGSQQELADALEDCAKIVPYLISIETTDLIAFEDILLKLAVQAGDYCGRGIKLATNEIMAQLMQSGQSVQGGAPEDPIRTYERKLETGLQAARLRIIQETYLVLGTTGLIPPGIHQDVHGFDMYRVALSLGFYPFTESEKRKFGIGDLVSWQAWNWIHEEVYYKSYKSQLDECIRATGMLEASNYTRHLINTNPTLSDAEKDDILRMWISSNDGYWTQEGTNRKFNQLMLVMLGVLKF